MTTLVWKKILEVNANVTDVVAEIILPSLHFDPETDQVVGDDEANRLPHEGDRGYRAPFIIADEISSNA